MKTRFFACVAIVAMFASCQKAEVEVVPQAEGCATFSAAINNGPVTRAFDQEWEADDAIGIFCENGKSYKNVKYVTEGGAAGASGVTFTPAILGTDIYYQSDDPATFTAYYPWTDHTTTEVAINTTAQKNQKIFDMLWAQAEGRKASPAVHFDFAHKMTKLCITIKPGKDVDFNDEVKTAEYSLEGLKLAGKLEVATGTVTAEGGTATLAFGNSSTGDNNAPYTDNGIQSRTYTLILLPQTASKVTFSASTKKYGTQTFTVDLDFAAANDTPENQLLAGKQYNVTLKLSKTALSLENGCKITDWQAVDFDGELEAK